MRGIILVVLMLIAAGASAQRKVIESVKSSVSALESEAHISFLASDEMRGRDTGSPEIDIAANYISTQLRIFGAKPVQGDSNYLSGSAP